GEVPASGHVRLAAPRLGHDLAAEEKTQLDPHAGEPDTLPAGLAARGDVVVARQLAPLHSGPVVRDGEGRLRGLGPEPDAARSRIERVGDDLGEDGLLEGAGISVAQILEQMEKVNTCLAHASSG